MKRKTRILLGVGTMLGVFVAGAIWLAKAVMEVADDTVNTTLSAARSIEKIVQDEPVTPARTIAQKNQNRDADMKPQPAPASNSEQVAKQTPALATVVPDSGAVSKNGVGTDTSVESVNKRDKKAGTLAETDVLTVIEQNVGPLLGDDADDTMDVSALTKAFRDDSSDDDWLALVPGGKSPTLQNLVAGKYAGKEGQALEDAIGDPQAWRLFSFLGGLW